MGDAPPVTTADGRRPLVVVCLAPADQRPDVDPVTASVHVDPRRADLSPSDAAALELGLQAAERWGATVTAVAVGPVSVEPLLRLARSVGADVVRVVPPGHDGRRDPGPGPVPVEAVDVAGQPDLMAAAITDALSDTGRPDLVICGDRSSLAGTGSVPAFLAERLGAAQALGCVSVSFGSDPGTVEVVRRLDAGWTERIRLAAPAVISVEAAGLRLRRAPLAAALHAETVPVPEHRAAPPPAWSGAGVAVAYSAPHPYRPRTRVVAPPTGGTHDRIVALTGALSERQPPRIVGPVGAVEAADELLDFLARQGFGPAE